MVKKDLVIHVDGGCRQTYGARAKTPTRRQWRNVSAGFRHLACCLLIVLSSPTVFGATPEQVDVTPWRVWGISGHATTFKHHSFQELVAEQVPLMIEANSGWHPGWWEAYSPRTHEGQCIGCSGYTSYVEPGTSYNAHATGTITIEAYFPHINTYWRTHRPALGIWQCPAGYNLTATGPGNDGYPPVCRCNGNNCVDPAKSELGKPKQCVGNPCDPLTGNKFQAETDYRSAGPDALEFVRYYNSNPAVYSGALGEHWRHSYDRRLESTSGTVTRRIQAPGLYYYDEETGRWVPEDRFLEYSLETAVVQRPDGKRINFSRTGGGPWVADSDITERLESTATGWRYVNDDDEVETYDSSGRLTAITKRGGRTLTLTYADVAEFDTPQLVQVADRFGRTLNFSYENGRLVRVNDVHYGHDASGRLVTRTDEEGYTRRYVYEDTAFANALTGIIDENGDRYATWSYDAAGKVISSTHAGGVEAVSLAYVAPGITDVTDSMGSTTRYSSENILGVRHVVGISSPCSGCSGIGDQSIQYDGFGNILGRTGFDGTASSYSHNARGLEVSKTEALATAGERTITTAWHANFRVPTRIAEPGRITEFSYDANGNRLSETVTDTATNESRTTTWTYNSMGLLETVDGPRTSVNDVTTYGYDGYGNLVSVTNALDHVTRFTRYDAHGNPLEIIDPNGVVTELEYDLRQRLIRRTVAAGTAAAATTRFDYDPAGQLIRTTLPNGAWIAYEYDAAHRMTAVADNAGNRIDYVLDAMGNRIEERVSGPDRGTVRETFRDYNTLNRLVTESGPEGSRVDYGYDAEGNRTSIMDAANNSTTHRYDALDRLFETVDALGGVTRYDYDPRDNLTQVIDPRGVTTDYVYNGFNELVETRSPDAGTTTYTYDAAGNRVSQTDARGITVNYTYDALNRLTFIDYPEPVDGSASKDIRYVYDEGPNGIGRLSRIEDETGYIEYAYDVRGNLAHKLSVVRSELGEQYLPLGYSHDAADNLASISYPSGNVVQYQRDAHGRITGLSLTRADGTQVNLVSGIQYVPFGPASAKTFGNGLAETRTFDREGRITHIQSSALDYRYSWDVLGNITAIADNLDASRNQTFGYDALYRLTNADGIYGNLAWAYDAVGNRIEEAVIPVETGIQEFTHYTYATDSNRLTSVNAPDGTASYLYDEAGNTLDNDKQQFAYDARNRFTSAVIPAEAGIQYTYQHNALGQRVTKPRFQTAIPGDASGDGIIDQNDLLVLRDIIKGRAPASDGADCNQDGIVDNKDTSCIATRIGDTRNNGKGNRSDAGAPSGANLSTMDATVSSDGPGTIVGEILFAYDEAGHLIGEYDENGNRLREYVWLGDRPIAMVDNGNMYYIHVDHLNTPKVVTDANQKVVWKGDYTPFGEVEETVSSVEMRLRFPGQYYDVETGLNYNWNRSYAPKIGRYTQADPIGVNGGINIFSYVSENPIVRFDPQGFRWEFIGWHTKKHFGWWSHWRKLYARCEKEECGEKLVRLEYALYEQWRPIPLNTTPMPSYGNMGNSGAVDAFMDLVEAGMQAHEQGSMTKFEKYLSMPHVFGQQFCDRIKE